MDKAIGIIGLGRMGYEMLKKLSEAGYTVFCRDINKVAEDKAKTSGGKIVGSPKEMTEHAQVILLSLPMPSDVREVVLGERGLLTDSGNSFIIVDLSTIDPFTTQQNSKEAKKRGCGYIDAPVLGRPQACGRWTLPVGGEMEDLSKVRGALEILAANVIHVGPAGSGNIVKLLNNLMLGAISSITAEILAICAKLGMNPRVFYETIANSGAASVSGLFKEMGVKILRRDFEPLFSIDLLHKDVALGIQMAKEAGVPLIVSESNQLLNEMARLKGFGKEDTSGVIKIYEDLLGIEVRG